MSQRFGSSTLHQRDPRSALFGNYDGQPSSSHAPSRNANNSSPSYAYPGSAQNLGVNGSGGAGGLGGGYRPATPNSRGQYSDATLNELESQNDGEVSGILGKVRLLKDMTIAIGDEIRDSTALAEKMNDSFDGTRVRLRGTMNRMLLMAERTGVGWKVWLAFFAAVALLFWYVWLF
ncbi:hypothetical protein B0O99DRAFT_216280 [Bisporella sp. PMI_857]|nr:hypothetical protein B0O99DRAFT_216280 [Bisporella sp. PMI_857]